MRALFALLGVVLVGCSSEESGTESAPLDSGTAVDSAVAVDSTTPLDSGGVDTSVADGTTVDTSVAETSTTDTSAADVADTKPPLGAPITAPKSTWTWVDFADSTCDDGTKTGIGVNLADGPNVLVFHNGGGACWDATTCFTLRTATTGPYGATQFATTSTTLNTAIFDRTDATNPFKDYSFVFVPYCTGDWHAGENVASYVVSGTTRTYHHEGRKNVRAFLARLGATFTAPTKVVVTGSSAGGFGATLDYDLYRAMWPSAQSYLLADAAPLLKNDDFPATLRNQLYANWRLDKFLDSSCPACKTDMSALIKARAAAYPSDRIGLLSTTQDTVVRTTFSLGATAFETALLGLGTSVYDPTTRARYFFFAGSQHTLMFAWSAYVTGGVDAKTWIRRFVQDDTTWASVKP